MKGISPVVAVVLLIAIAVIAAVTVWYWVSGMAGKPAIPGGAQAMLSFSQCDGTNQQVMVANSGGVAINTADIKVYPQGETTAYALVCDIGATLNPGDQSWCHIENETQGTVGPVTGQTYIVTGPGFNTQFTC